MKVNSNKIQKQVERITASWPFNRLFRQNHKKRNIDTHYCRMFVDDLSSGVYRHNRKDDNRDDQCMRIEPPSTDMERIISAALSTSGSRESLADSFGNFLGSTAQSLFIEGKAVFELKCVVGDEGTVKHFALNPQYRNTTGSAPAGSRVTKAAKANLFMIEFPAELGGMNRIRAVTERLSVLGVEPLPSFYLDDLATNTNVGFDIDEFFHSKFVETATLTSEFGWNQRETSTSKFTEWYSLLLYARKRRAQAVVRNEIVRAFNEVINRPPLNLGVRVVLSGFIETSDADRQIEKLRAGGTPFKDIYDALKD